MAHHDDGDEDILQVTIPQIRLMKERGQRSQHKTRRLTLQNQLAVQPNLPQANVSGQQNLLRALSQLVAEKKDYDKADWSLATGPKPVTKWEGGAAPNRPQWKYEQDDI